MLTQFILVVQSTYAELIKLYWNVGEYLSTENGKTSWGASFIDETAKFIKENCPEIKGFTRRGLYRMKQFYETYKDDEIVSTVLTQISWSNHLQILSSTKTQEERQFYIKLCIKEKYSARELQRQISSAYFSRCMLSKQTYKGYTTLNELPRGKDFNEDLQALAAQIRAEKRTKARHHDVSI